ncbi:Protein CBG26840 [Caenorhabditis briggsae]|uniref:Protein CBG26840 n=1 Tax=Caenorhabditis briggsae TaxID=6238 RepID=B6ILR4_CAEBR|nr:Protein CBG26840 [Caenorhabditis briggsae]CAS00844.1 Protein CBG26840 [Caenorhabditis briggsae]
MQCRTVAKKKRKGRNCEKEKEPFSLRNFTSDT